MSKGGYIRICFGLCYALLSVGPFFGWWCVVGDIFWLVVGGGGW